MITGDTSSFAPRKPKPIERSSAGCEFSACGCGSWLADISTSAGRAPPRKHESGMIKSTPSKISSQGTDWRFFNGSSES